MDLLTELVELEKLGCDITIKGPDKFQDDRSICVKYHERIGGWIMDVKKDISKGTLQEVYEYIPSIRKDLSKLDIWKGSD